ncbi:HelD family protein [Timonella senegalensis]|uniref:HelD family protein n=1 Tax=Timonella senegalensis TaxID=1465825 RepID=UPI0028A9A804|nr:PhoH family protein [Timonella senegalensis]
MSTTLASLLPDITATATDDPAVQRLKGDPRFATFIKRAVKARERVPSADQTVRIDGHDLVIRRRDIRDAMFRARRTNKPHNLARKTFVKDMLSKLAAQYVADMPYEVAPEDRSEIIDEIRLNREVRVALNIAWFPITPMKLVEDLFAKPHRLAQAAPELTASERALLAREAGSPWTDSDIPILDEAFEMLGEDDSAAHAEAQRAQKAHAQALEYARQVLESSGGDSIVGADVLAGRFVDSGPTLTTAERASRDRTWTYAHVIVDEAQELSPMAWRMLVRRCPTRSFTIVGDVAQTSNPAGATSWSRMLAPIFRDQRQIRELTINYRTPSTIADAAIAFARANSLPVSPLTSARDAADSLRYVPTDRTTIVENMTQQITDDIGAFVSAGTGRVAVVAPQELLTELEAALPAQLREQLTGPDPIVSLVTPVQAKGLEYDAVIVGLPSEIVRSINGVSDLFVAMTRATQRLTMFHTTGLPAGL